MFLSGIRSFDYALVFPFYFRKIRKNEHHSVSMKVTVLQLKVYYTVKLRSTLSRPTRKKNRPKVYL